MGFSDNLFDLGKTLLTADVQLKQVQEESSRLQQQFQEHVAKVEAKFDELTASISALSERVARLESFRDADRREVQAILVQIQTAASHVEFLTKQLPPSPSEP